MLTIPHHVCLSIIHMFSNLFANSFIEVIKELFADIWEIMSSTIGPAALEGASLLWLILSHPFTVGVYAVILLIMVIVLISNVLVGESRFAKLPDDVSKAAAEELAKEISEGLLAPKNSEEQNPEKPQEQEKPKEEEKKDEEEEEVPSRFYMLSELDRWAETYQAPAYNNNITLEELCERFRNFAAGRLHLYYDIKDIRRFVAGLAVTHIIIMQGMSGTGKTSLAYAFGEFMQNQSVIVPIQPMWKERTDMIGYYNEFTKRFNETVLLRKMYEANWNDNIYITVLDEMNIARVEYYFAEFLSLLELPNPEQRYLDVVSDKWENDPKLLKDGQIRLPANMWFVGTANNDDSTFAISDKVYDRAMVMNLDQKADYFEAEDAEPVYMSKTHWEKLVKDAQDEYALSERNRRRLAMLDDYLIDKFRITFGNRIMKQINQYIPVCLACGGDELDALDDILARKVLRKLESQNPVYVRSAADGLCVYLEELFGSDRMTLCRDYLRRLERSAYV